MIEVNNFVRSKVDKNFLKEISRLVLEKEKKEKLDLSIALIDSKKMKEANRRYRKINKETDVLAFEKNQKINFDAAEILICPSQVKKNAKKYKTTFKQELGRVLIHGTLHILGYDHEEWLEAQKMRKKENYYFSQIISN